MNIEEFRDFCLQLPGTSECFPFDEHTLVFKVMDKVYALTKLNTEDFRVNLKCEPSYALELRDLYSDIQPGYHMNKKHWNTVSFAGGIPDKVLKTLIEHSYKEVEKKLTKKQRSDLQNFG
ncbi:MmcQ/YjbR family DNA-binding protein [Apibacter raozihei]|uniref:MmcQ/YjbR family DNA-binding protein n=1 Tax=Apibacter TaxID=1778601 RepID=UPI000FE37830|nr:MULTISPECIES: MmcQ/YjbR family DNA-binding protein [Apibacter]